jgi:hypothetical protein
MLSIYLVVSILLVAAASKQATRGEIQEQRSRIHSFIHWGS